MPTNLCLEQCTCVLFLPQDLWQFYLHDDHKACMGTANNTVVEYGVKSVRIIYK